MASRRRVDQFNIRAIKKRLTLLPPRHAGAVDPHRAWAGESAERETRRRSDRHRADRLVAEVLAYRFDRFATGQNRAGSIPRQLAGAESHEFKIDHNQS